MKTDNHLGDVQQQLVVLWEVGTDLDRRIAADVVSGLARIAKRRQPRKRKGTTTTATS